MSSPYPVARVHGAAPPDAGQRPIPEFGNFGKVFTRLTGTTPGEFRRTHQGVVAP